MKRRESDPVVMLGLALTIAAVVVVALIATVVITIAAAGSA